MLLLLIFISGCYLSKIFLVRFSSNLYLYILFWKLFTSSYSNHCFAWLFNYLELPRILILSWCLFQIFNHMPFIVKLIMVIFALYHQNLVQYTYCLWQLVFLYVVVSMDHIHLGFCFLLTYFLPRNSFCSHCLSCFLVDLSWGWLMGDATCRAICRLASQESPRLEDKKTGSAWRASCASSRPAIPPWKAGAGRWRQSLPTVIWPKVGRPRQERQRPRTGVTSATTKSNQSATKNPSPR
jgi:hypothetical protein